MLPAILRTLVGAAVKQFPKLAKGGSAAAAKQGAKAGAKEGAKAAASGAGSASRKSMFADMAGDLMGSLFENRFEPEKTKTKSEFTEAYKQETDYVEGAPPVDRRYRQSKSEGTGQKHNWMSFLDKSNESSSSKNDLLNKIGSLLSMAPGRSRRSATARSFGDVLQKAGTGEIDIQSILGGKGLGGKVRNAMDSPLGDLAIKGAMDYGIFRAATRRNRGGYQGLPPSTAAGQVRQQIKGQAGQFVGNVTRMINPFNIPSSVKRLFTQVKQLPDQLTRWGDALQNSQRYLEMYNVTIAETMRQSELADLKRNIGVGQRTAGSVAGVVKSVDSLKDAIQPYRDLGTNLTNRVVQLGSNVANVFIKLAEYATPIDELVDFANWFMGKEGEDQKQSLFNQFVNDRADLINNPLPPNQPVANLPGNQRQGRGAKGKGP